MGYRLTGLGALGLSVNWEKTRGDKAMARRVITFLEDRRVLYERDREAEDEVYTVRSALEVRAFLTEQLAEAKPGDSLTQSLKAVRSAFRRFVDTAGPDGRDFAGWHGRWQTDPLSLALGELRGVVGVHLAVIAGQYGIKTTPELTSIFPAAPDEDDAPGLDL